MNHQWDPYNMISNHHVRDPSVTPVDVTVILATLQASLGIAKRTEDVPMPEAEPLDAEMPDASPTVTQPTR